MVYSNITLSSGDGSLEVVVYLPSGIGNDTQVFYSGSRFDHGSMIGSIKRKAKNGNSHMLFGSTLWRVPHNSHWPESGIGLASEFGVGDDGDYCPYRCGWSERGGVTNGVLGYAEAKAGEPFLKIGVGKLVKGSCPQCDSAGDYKFNSPYLFAEQPVWKLEAHEQSIVRLSHEAILNDYGYRLRKDISLGTDVLDVKTTLTNLGKETFVSAWYSHNFFSCDGMAVGPGYSLEVGLGGLRDPIYVEPDTWTWSTPLDQYATVSRTKDSIDICLDRDLEPGIRVRTELLDDGQTTGNFKLKGCSSVVAGSIPEILRSLPPNPSLSMYAYNIYAERGTLSPEPQILINLASGESTSWTQHLEIHGTNEKLSTDLSTTSFRAVALAGLPPAPSQPGASLVSSHLTALAFLSLLALSVTKLVNRRRHAYVSLPNVEDVTIPR